LPQITFPRSIRGTVNDHAQQTVQTAEHVLKMEPLSIGRKRAHCVCLTGRERLQQELRLERRRLKRRKTRSSPHVKATHLNQSNEHISSLDQLELELGAADTAPFSHFVGRKI